MYDFPINLDGAHYRVSQLLLLLLLLFLFSFSFFFNFIIKAKFHSKLYMMIIVHFFLANWSLMLLLTPQLTLLRNFVFTMIYFPPHVNANQSSLTYKTFGYYLRRATKLNWKVKKTLFSLCIYYVFCNSWSIWEF